MSADKRYTVPIAQARRHSRDIEACCAEWEAKGWTAPSSVKCRISLARETYELGFRRSSAANVGVTFTEVLRYARVPVLPKQRVRK